MLLRRIDCWLFLGEALIFKEPVKRPALFLWIVEAGDRYGNRLEQIMCFKSVEMGGLWHLQRILRRFFD